MTDGLKPEHRQAIIETLSANPKVERIVLFGSRAKGTFTRTSDVDLALFGDDLTLSDQAALAEAVAELSVPQRVDILIYHRIESQALREEIRKHGVEWFARERATQAVNTAGDWQELPFSQAVIVNPRVHLKRGEIYSFVDMNAIIAGRRSAYASEQRRFNGGGSRFAAGDTLMARITPCLENGKIARFAGRPGEVAHGSTEFIVIRGRDGVSDTSYAYYLTKWDGVSGYAISQMTGTSGRQRVPPEALDHLTVPLPPLPEQRAIAHILGTLDDKIELNRRMSQTLEAMARALFKSWFVDFEPVRAKVEGCWRRGNPLLPLPEGEGRGEGSLPTKSHARLSSDLLAFARELRQNETDAERLLWRLLRNRYLAGAKFRRQHPFPPYVLDFYCHELKLAIELDGGLHNLPEGRLHDKVRRRNWRSTESASFVFGITRCCATPRAC